jgi:hypothetical protein
MFQSTQTCHPEARRAEGTGPKPPYMRNHRFLRPCGPQDDRSGKIRGNYVFTSNRNHTQSRETRNPLLLFLLSGLFLFRFAERQLLSLLFQLPPRSTRCQTYPLRAKIPIFQKKIFGFADPLPRISPPTRGRSTPQAGAFNCPPPCCVPSPRSPAAFAHRKARTGKPNHWRARRKPR